MPQRNPPRDWTADAILKLVTPKIKQLIKRALSGSGIGGGDTVDHGTLDGLSDDDHTQYLRVDGTREMSGDLDMGGNAITDVGNVDGRDVSADGAVLDTAVLDGDFTTAGLMTRLSVSGSYASRSIAGGTGIAVAGGTGTAGNPTISLDVNSLTAMTDPVFADAMAIYDAGVADHRKVSPEYVTKTALIYERMMTVTVASTTAYTNVASVTVRAGQLINRGLRLWIPAEYFNSSGTARNFSMRVQVNGNTLWEDTATNLLANANTRACMFEFMFHGRSNLSLVFNGHGLIGNPGAPTTGTGVYQQPFRMGPFYTVTAIPLGLSMTITADVAHSFSSALLSYTSPSALARLW